MAIKIVPDTLLDPAVTFSWQRCQNSSARSYPLFANHAALDTEFRHRQKQADGFLAYSYHFGDLQGVICGFTEPENNYLQTTGFYLREGDSNTAEALACWLQEAYPGFTADIGLPADNQTAAAALCKYGYQLIDDSLDLRLDPRHFQDTGIQTPAVQQIDKNSLPQYLAYHRQHFSDYYWNAERLQKHFADWQVYAYMPHAHIRGALFMRCYANHTAEVFGLQAETEAAATALLSRTMQNLFAQKPQITSVICMTDAGDYFAVNAALQLGFVQENHYRCYEKVL